MNQSYTTVKSSKGEVTFSYNFYPSAPVLLGNLDEVPFRNNISIFDCSENLNVSISNGKIKVGNAVFGIDFSTFGMSETISIYGQFHMAIKSLMEEE